MILMTFGHIAGIYLQQDTIFWEGEGYSLNQALSDLPGLGEAVEALLGHDRRDYLTWKGSSSWRD